MIKPGRATLTLLDGVLLSGMSYEELWIAQLSMGGDAGLLEVEAYVLGLLHPDAFQHNVLAQSINEHFIEIGADHPVAYADEPPC